MTNDTQAGRCCEKCHCDGRGCAQKSDWKERFPVCKELGFCHDKDCECHHAPSSGWEEELKRQCEIRNLPFADVLYLSKEVAQAEIAKTKAAIREKFPVEMVVPKMPPRGDLLRTVEVAMEAMKAIGFNSARLEAIRAVDEAV